MIYSYLLLSFFAFILWERGRQGAPSLLADEGRFEIEGDRSGFPFEVSRWLGITQICLLSS